jgi:hypothetical protein
MEFFYTKVPQKDNLVLAHYYTDNPKGIVVPSWEKNFTIRCNNLLAHLTFERINLRSRDEHHWPDLGEKVRDMEAEINRFLGSLKPERRNWFK